jgi:hypothetical protein
MRKRILKNITPLGAAFLTALTAVMFFVLAAPAAAEPQDAITGAAAVYTAKVVLLGAENLSPAEGERSRLRLQLPEGTTLVELAAFCRFSDRRGAEMPLSSFAKRFENKTVTIEFVENAEGEYLVLACYEGGS